MEITNYKFFQNLKNCDFVDEIFLFGSRARKDNQERADIDLAISCKNASDKNWEKILEIIENADTLLKIDCVRFDKLKDSSDLKKAIIKEGKKIYDKSKN